MTTNKPVKLQCSNSASMLGTNKIEKPVVYLKNPLTNSLDRGIVAGYLTKNIVIWVNRKASAGLKSGTWVGCGKLITFLGQVDALLKTMLLLPLSW